MRQRLFRQSAFALMLTASVAASGAAQASGTVGSCSINGSGNNKVCENQVNHTAIAFTIGKTVRLTVQQGGSFSLLPTAALLSATDFNTGYFDATGFVRLQVSANTGWNVAIKSASGTFSGCTAKNADALKWGTTSGSRSNAVTTTDATVFSGTSATTLTTQDVYFRVNLGWTTDAPVAASSCTLPVSFTANAP